MIEDDNIEITNANKQDIDGLILARISLLSEVGKHPDENFIHTTVEYFKKNLGNDELIANVAKFKGKIIATVILCLYEAIPTSSNRNGKYGRIFSVYTDPKFRGKGVGSKLLQKTVDDAKANGITGIFLKSEAKAVPLYKKLGFVDSDREMALYLDLIK